MKNAVRIFLFTLIVSVISLSSASVQAAPGRDVGLGFMLGAPTGLTGKFFLNQRRAIDVAVSFDFDEYVMIFGDYLAHFPGAFGRQNQFVSELTPYGGVGPIMVIATEDRHDAKYFDDNDGSFALGARIPLGIEWKGTTIPLGIGVEIAPGLTVVPGTYAFLQAALTLRFYF